MFECSKKYLIFKMTLHKLFSAHTFNRPYRRITSHSWKKYDDFFFHFNFDCCFHFVVSNEMKYAKWVLLNRNGKKQQHEGRISTATIEFIRCSRCMKKCKKSCLNTTTAMQAITMTEPPAITSMCSTRLANFPIAAINAYFLLLCIY